MKRPDQPHKCKARAEDSRWFAHCLFGRCDDAANDWRTAAPAPKKAA